MIGIGEFAALATAFLWAAGSLLFTAAVFRTGAFAVNAVRLAVAFVLLAAFSFLTHGTSWSKGAGTDQWVLLVVSGWIGLSLGDWGYLRAFQLIGARLTTLAMTLSPPFTALMAIPLLDESIGMRGVAGMAVTLLGVGWVVLERSSASGIPRGHRILGVTLAVLGSLGQAVGFVFSKWGMGETIDPLPATAVRMGAGALAVWVFVAIQGRWHEIRELWRTIPARRATLSASVVGPVAGVWLSLVAVRYTEAGIAATIIATVPVIIVPLTRIVHGEPITFRAIAGALVAVTGVGILVLG